MKQKLLDHVDRMLAEDIAVLMNMIPKEDESQGDMETNVVKGGAFEGYKESPFGVGRLEGVDKGRGDEEWVVAKDRYKYDEIFQVWLNVADYCSLFAIAETALRLMQCWRFN